MYNNQFYNQFNNPQYINPDYYDQVRDQIARYQYEQSQTQEVANVVKAVHDLCESYRKLDSQHQQQAFELSLAEIAIQLGWNNR